jgi:hypothetical protein
MFSAKVIDVVKDKRNLISVDVSTTVCHTMDLLQRQNILSVAISRDYEDNDRKNALVCGDKEFIGIVSIVVSRLILHINLC